MKKQRTSPTILKPLIDEETALRFATAGSEPSSVHLTNAARKTASKHSPAPRSTQANLQKDMRQISLAISKDLYNKIAKEAARKSRTVEEHLKKHLAKRYDK
jgi:hypothetical protein